MSAIQDLFLQAQLAEAAYADFAGMGIATPRQTLIDALTTGDGKFSIAQATAFATQWRVIDQYNNSFFGGLVGTGFSATLFERLDASGGTGQFSLAIRGSLDAADFVADTKLIATDGVAFRRWSTSTTTGQV